jgi:serine/threonine protein kinase
LPSIASRARSTSVANGPVSIPAASCLETACLLVIRPFCHAESCWRRARPDKLSALNEELDELEARSRERVGQTLHDKWRLERLLGLGGMAAVYEGRHRNGARAAIKVLHSHLSRHREVRERFRREAYVSNRIEHPGAVKCLDDDVAPDGPDAGTAYIVMELLSGESLEQRIEREPPLNELEFLRLAGSVLEVLRIAHAQGIVHRDLKPDNLFLARVPEGGPAAVRVKVLDFGMARLLQEQAITSYGVALGTPSFMSPEQASGRNDEVDGRTDLFALGATGYRIRTGRRIHEADSLIELVRKMAYTPAPRIRSIDPLVSEPFARVIDRALEFKRDDRYEDAATMIADVRKALAQLEGETDRMTVPPRTRGDAATRTPDDADQATLVLSSSDLEPWTGSDTPAASRPKRRRSVLGWAIGLAVVGIAGVEIAERVPPPSWWPWTPEPIEAVADAGTSGVVSEAMSEATSPPRAPQTKEERRDAGHAPGIAKPKPPSPSAPRPGPSGRPAH